MNTLPANQDFRRFLVSVIAVVIVGVLLAVAFVVVVDPYGIYRLVDAPGLNRVKPAPDRYQEEIKLSAARNAKANVIVLGNSRSEIGLNPASLADPAKGYVPYNLAISGTNIATARDELEYLDRIGHKPAVIVLGVDFLDFLVDPAAKPVAQPPHGNKVGAFKWQFDALFSLYSLMDAVTTLQIQHGGDIQTMAPNGYNPLLEYNKYAREEGYYAIFRQRAGEYAQTFVRKPHGLLMTQTGTSPDLEDLRAIIALASRENAELHVLIYPYHTQMLAMFEQAGLWPAFEQWKALLAQETAQARQRNADARVTLWDFSGFGPMQCEPIPAKGDTRSATQWYWEAGHFKSQFGDLILQRLQGKEQGLPADLGFALTPANVEQDRQRVANERATCLAAQPQLFDEAKQLIGDARQKMQ